MFGNSGLFRHSSGRIKDLVSHFSTGEIWWSWLMEVMTSKLTTMGGTAMHTTTTTTTFQRLPSPPQLMQWSFKPKFSLNQFPNKMRDIFILNTTCFLRAEMSQKHMNVGKDTGTTGSVHGF